MKKERLFTPGPVEIPPRVLKVLSEPIIHHRTKEFQEKFLQTRELFKRLINSKSENFVFFASSGTGAMESAIVNFFSAGDKVLVINAGKFGERWKEISEKYGLEVIELKYPWGKAVKIEDIKINLEKHPDIKGILFQISETSTGVEHDYKAIGEIAKEKDLLVVADAITALGVYNLQPEKDGIDILVGGSQKALMLPPGLAILWFSEKALRKLKTGNISKYYFDVEKELKKQIKGSTAYTPAINLILALKESLEILLEEGMENIEKRYRFLSSAMQTALKELGLKIFPEKPAISLTAFEHEQAEEIRKKLLQLGIRTAGGQEHLKGRLVRISHMGYLDLLDFLSVISALEVVLVQITGNYRTLGKATPVFQKELLNFLKN
jgi:aspartate aminotransferase-like enzyme